MKLTGMKIKFIVSTDTTQIVVYLSFVASYKKLRYFIIFNYQKAFIRIFDTSFFLLQDNLFKFTPREYKFKGYSKTRFKDFFKDFCDFKKNTQI